MSKVYIYECPRPNCKYRESYSKMQGAIKCPKCGNRMIRK